MHRRDRRHTRIGKVLDKKQIKRRRQHRHEMHRRPPGVGYDDQIGRAVTLAQHWRILRHVHADAMFGHRQRTHRRRVHETRRRGNSYLLKEQAERGQQGEGKAHSVIVQGI